MHNVLPALSSNIFIWIKVYGLVALVAWLCVCLARPDHGFDASDLRAGHLELLRTEVTPRPRGGRRLAPSAVLSPPRVISPPGVSYPVTPTEVATSSGTRRALDVSSSKGHGPSSTRAAPSSSSSPQGHSARSSRGNVRYSTPSTYSHIATGAPTQGHFAPSTYSHIGTGAPTQGHPSTSIHIGTGAPTQGHPSTSNHIATGAPTQGHFAPSTYSHIGTGAPTQGHPSTSIHIGTGAPTQGHSSTSNHIATGAPTQGHFAPSTYSHIGTGAPTQGHSATSSMVRGSPQNSVSSFHQGVFNQIYGPPKQSAVLTNKPGARPVTQDVPATYVPPIYVPRTPTYTPPSSGYLPPSNVRPSPLTPSKSHSTLKVSRDSSSSTSKEVPSSEVYFNLGDAFNYDVPPPSGASSSSGLQKTHRTTPTAVVVTRRPKTTYQTPKRTPPTGKPSSSKEETSNYSYNYSVQGDTVVDSYGGKKEGPNFGHSEKRNGRLTEGRYFVKLPDGRTQIVEYYADETGYHPTITYV
ncbi:uncharacterized protein [Panulirus ornatus]|uniref:uncharacterized protein n=1 Tax=Panulirus ornatus TaxID=150431 RepID=UPI003A889221